MLYGNLVTDILCSIRLVYYGSIYSNFKADHNCKLIFIFFVSTLSCLCYMVFGTFNNI